MNQVNSDVTMAEITGTYMSKTRIDNMLLDINIPAIIQRNLTADSPLWEEGKGFGW